MGNTPAKEVRPASATYNGSHKSEHDLFLSDIEDIGLAGLSRKKKEKERERRKRREEHLLNLIVRYEENVDGGYLAPYGNYKYNLSYKTQVVRDLIIERRLAPFYTPLEDYDSRWPDRQLLAHIHLTNLHATCTSEDLEDEEEDPDEHKIYQSLSSIRRHENKLFRKRLKERAVEMQNSSNDKYRRDKMTQQSGIRKFPNIPSDSLLLRLYKGAEECPICFLYYPKNLNMTRCCSQPICTECFVQMKRLDPHVPHEEGSSAHESAPDAESPAANADDFVSEPVKCPFCAMPDFGVIYEPPEFRSGIGGVSPSEYKAKEATIKEDETVSTETKIQSGVHEARHSRKLSSALTKTRKRRGSLPPNAPGVITIDTIYPDWEQRLLNARTKAARRSAAATALHASSLIVGDSTGSHLGGGRSSLLKRHDSGSRALNKKEQLDIEQKMIQEAMRLSLLDEEERKMKERVKEKEKEQASEHERLRNEFHKGK